MLENAPTLVDQAVTRLRRDVLTGTFAAGTKLKVDELQTTYGFSNTPIREALTRLTQEGLVSSDHRRGFRVAPMTVDDLADITRMRLMLDVQALKESILRGDDAWEASIVAAYHRLEKIEARFPDGPVMLDDDWGSLHKDFHLALMSACASQRQLAWSSSLFDQAERYRRHSARFRKTSRRKSNEHKRLMEATIRRDVDTAEALLVEHINGTMKNVLAAMKLASAGGSLVF